MKEKKIETRDYSCNSCGGALIYSPPRQKLFCTKCESTRDIEFVPLNDKKLWEQRDKGIKKTKSNENVKKHLKCPNCGAKVEVNELEYSKVCPYCESSLVSEQSLITQIEEPDGIIPFKLSKEEAAEKYTKGVKKKFFVPSAFKKAPPTENIKGIYIPSFSFDAKGDSKYSGVLEKDYTYRDSNGHSRTRTETKRIAGTHKSNNIDVVVESSTALNQAQISEILPFDMGEVVAYKPEFILGYTVEQYENTVEECKKIGTRIMEDNIKRAILRGYSYDRVRTFNMTTAFSEEKYMYYLLPIYNCKFNYKNKDYNTFMNGQSGKVGGGFPISPLKVTLAVIIGILLLGLFSALFFVL